MELIAQGAEAKLYREGDIIVKERISKSYRVPELDKTLRQFRTRREAKILAKLEIAPELIDVCEKTMTIKMQNLKGQKLKDILTIQHAKALGQLISSLHSKDIIHSDLTTSNMIVVDKKIHLIDFGLSFFSCKAEDKAVDLHLFRRALESAHHEIFEKVWAEFMKNYKHEEVLKRLETVEKRGRYKSQKS